MAISLRAERTRQEVKDATLFVVVVAYGIEAAMMTIAYCVLPAASQSRGKKTQRLDSRFSIDKYNPGNARDLTQKVSYVPQGDEGIPILN